MKLKYILSYSLAAGVIRRFSFVVWTGYGRLHRRAWALDAGLITLVLQVEHSHKKSLTAKYDFSFLGRSGTGCPLLLNRVQDKLKPEMKCR